MIDGYTGFLILDKNGKPLVALHWEKYFNCICEKYNKVYRVQMPNVTPHVCRHRFCSRMAATRMNLKTLQYIMGHSDISVTLDTYTHLGFDEVADEMKRVAGNNLWGKRKRFTSIFTSFKYYKMLSYTSFCKEKIYNIFLIKPVLIGIWEHLKENKKLWQKSYLSATALQFYDDAYLRKVGQHRAEYGGKHWKYYVFDY